MRFVFTLVAVTGAFDGEPFPVIPSGLPLRCTPGAADGITPFFLDGDARSKVGYGRETGKNMLSSRLPPADQFRTLALAPRPALVQRKAIEIQIGNLRCVGGSRSARSARGVSAEAMEEGSRPGHDNSWVRG